MLQRPLVILGAGYTGRSLFALAKNQKRPVLASSRSPDDHLNFVPPPYRIRFDLDRRSTWQNVPADAHVLWCFPAAPEEHVARFAQQAFSERTRLVVLGSTSAYDVSILRSPDAEASIDESWPLDFKQPRVRGEEYLRLHHGATVLRVAGIYGPGRNVLDWIRRGKAGASTRYVNMIHVEDLAAICLLALERAKPGESYNVSDGIPRRWADICAEAERRWRIPFIQTTDARPGKRISIAKLRRDFNYSFRHSDLYAALESIEPAAV